MSGELHIRTGGLYRCCIASLQELPAEFVTAEGVATTCTYCNADMVFRSGAWEWGVARALAPT